MTFAFLVKGDFGKSCPSSLKARPASVPTATGAEGTTCVPGEEGHWGNL